MLSRESEDAEAQLHVTGCPRTMEEQAFRKDYALCVFLLPSSGLSGDMKLEAQYFEPGRRDGRGGIQETRVDGGKGATNSILV